ncbi:MAG: transcriptional regulator [Zestosphaera sp.]
MGGVELTTRERILNLLLRSEGPLTAEDIISELGLRVTPGEVYEHLKHVAKTLKRAYGGSYYLAMVPPTCRSCGYVFKGLEEPRKPSKCPKCRSQRINPPAFKIVRK